MFARGTPVTHLVAIINGTTARIAPTIVGATMPLTTVGINARSIVAVSNASIVVLFAHVVG